jgi:hypothetical protein
VPSSHLISNQLRVKTEEGLRIPMDPKVQCLWQDLKWMKEQELLFDEHKPDASAYCRPLSQHNVNVRFSRFRPGFRSVSRRQRHIVPPEFVERPSTAVRLIALKDLYYFNGLEVPHPLLFEFFLQQRLIPNEEQFYTFLTSLFTVNYILILPSPAWLPTGQSDRVALLEPSETFRNRDMYLELRALDFFSTEKCSDVRQTRRLELHKAAEIFVAKKSGGV